MWDTNTVIFWLNVSFSSLQSIPAFPADCSYTCRASQGRNGEHWQVQLFALEKKLWTFCSLAQGEKLCYFWHITWCKLSGPAGFSRINPHLLAYAFNFVSDWYVSIFLQRGKWSNILPSQMNQPIKKTVHFINGCQVMTYHPSLTLVLHISFHQSKFHGI